jgi:hypothetical protein
VSSTPPAPLTSRPAICQCQVFAECHRETADQHQHQRQQHDALVAEALADSAARQRQRDARRKIEADQQPDIRDVDAEFRRQERRDRGDALELKRHHKPDQEEYDENRPAVAQCVPPAMSAG